ncbi:rho GTPase-activating protein 19-like isoform X2 [Ptychodera flava]|uniref:rho GTPase-activating protein 19-like isoform X2 n=1 Tax=Ptychodera flava TaxID=63121 RepID=UPI00396A3F83
MTSRAIYCNPNYYLEAMKHKYPDVFNEWCCNELSHVLDFSGTESVGDLLKGNCELKYPKSSIKRVKIQGQKRKVTGGVFGAPLTAEGYCQAKLLIEFLKRHLHVEGIFRVPGNSSRQCKLKEKIIGGDIIDLDTDIFTPHDVACVLKAFLGELPEPLLSDRQFQAHVQAAGLTYKIDGHNLPGSSEENIQKWREKRKQDHILALTYLFLMLPSSSYKLLLELLDLLHLAAKEQSNNKMTAFNLGVMFAPHILWPRYFTTEDVRDQDFVNKLNTGVEFMIKHAQKICKVPQFLLGKCESYIRNGGSLIPKQNVKETVVLERMPPDTPDGGVMISLPQPAGVHVRSRQNTEEALGKMYNDIKQMQPSAKRRKLMKNFAKNCHMPGTPNEVREDAARYMRAKKHSRSKSFGGVIKRHVLGTPSKKSSKGSVISPPKSERTPAGHVVRITNKSQDAITSTPSHQKPKHEAFSQRLFSADAARIDNETPKRSTSPSRIIYQNSPNHGKENTTSHKQHRLVTGNH